jgi:hypothetical protein
VLRTLSIPILWKRRLRCASKVEQENSKQSAFFFFFFLIHLNVLFFQPTRHHNLKYVLCSYCNGNGICPTSSYNDFVWVFAWSSLYGHYIGHIMGGLTGRSYWPKRIVNCVVQDSIPDISIVSLSIVKT